nr:hypothetical protein [Pseudomonas syringae]
MLHIMDAELIEGNYVLYQGDLSTNCVCCWEKLSCRVRDEPAPEKICECQSLRPASAPMISNNRH